MSNRKSQSCFVVCLIAFLVLFVATTASQAQNGQRFVAKLSGSQVVPSNASGGMGYATVIISPDNANITVNLGFSGLSSNATGGHIHTGAVGQNGSIIDNFSGGPTATSGVIPTQSFAINSTQLADLLSGNLYVDVHSTSFPGGEIRGQLITATCDTAGPIEVEATAGTIVPTAYTSLNTAFSAINAGTHQGTIGVEVCGNTTETASAVLNSGEISPAAYTSISMYPVGASRSITGNIAGAVIKLNGADRVGIGGLIDGIGTTRNLAVSNTSPASGTAAIWIASVAAGNGAMANGIVGLELSTGIDPTNNGISFGIIMCGPALSTTSNGIDSSGNAFIGNRIIRARYGIVTRGTFATPNFATGVLGNVIGPSSFGPDQISKDGILMQGDIGSSVGGNIVQFVGCLDTQVCSGSDRVGIAIGSDSWSTTDSTTFTGIYTVQGNIVHDIVDEKTFSAVGIKLGTTQGGASTNNVVANNFIYNLRSNGTANNQVCGIGISGGNADRIVHNSISITGDMDPGAAAASGTFGNAIRINGANTSSNNINFLVQNNSIYLDASSSSTPAMRYYAITLNSTAFSFGTGNLNNNNYFIIPSNTQLQTGGLETTGTGNAATNEFATLANWQNALTTPRDANSIQANPNYVSNTTDLHLIGTSPNINTAANAGITTDIDGQARPNGVGYDIGADEYYALTAGEVSVSGRVTTAEGRGITNTRISITGNSLKEPIVTITGRSGSYSIPNLRAGETYIVTVGSRRFTFANPSRVISLVDNVLDADFMADPVESVHVRSSDKTAKPWSQAGYK